MEWLTMGPYCQFCDQRCFVERRLPGVSDPDILTGTILMATCIKGAEQDRKATGYDYTTAINPRANPARIGLYPLREFSADELDVLDRFGMHPSTDVPEELTCWNCGTRKVVVEPDPQMDFTTDRVVCVDCRESQPDVGTVRMPSGSSWQGVAVTEVSGGSYPRRTITWARSGPLTANPSMFNPPSPLTYDEMDELSDALADADDGEDDLPGFLLARWAEQAEAAALKPDTPHARWLLADAVSKRMILADHLAVHNLVADLTSGRQGGSCDCHLVRCLARPYADHRNYRTDWDVPAEVLPGSYDGPQYVGPEQDEPELVDEEVDDDPTK